MNGESLLKKGQNLAKYLTLKKIHLWESRCSRDVSFAAKKAEVPLEIEVSVLEGNSKSVLPFACRFTLVATDKETHKKAFEVFVAFCVIYSVKGNYSPNKEEIEAFGATNAVFNIWPYAREFIQNLIIRMDLPPFTLPPVTISQLAKVGVTKEDSPTMTCND